jgi:hypothetical protein
VTGEDDIARFDSRRYSYTYHTDCTIPRRSGRLSSTPEVEFMNVKSCKISRFLPSTIHERVFPLDFWPVIDFSSPRSRLWISFSVEFKITRKLPVEMGGGFPLFPNSDVGQ